MTHYDTDDKTGGAPVQDVEKADVSVEEDAAPAYVADAEAERRCVLITVREYCEVHGAHLVGGVGLSAGLTCGWSPGPCLSTCSARLTAPTSYVRPVPDKHNPLTPGTPGKR